MSAWRLFVALVLFYVTLDLTTPMLPGAFDFNPDESVIGTTTIELRPVPPPPDLGPSNTPGQLDPVVTPEELSHPVARGAVVRSVSMSIQRAHVGQLRDPSSSSEDH